MLRASVSTVSVLALHVRSVRKDNRDRIKDYLEALEVTCKLVLKRFIQQQHELLGTRLARKSGKFFCKRAR